MTLTKNASLYNLTLLDKFNSLTPFSSFATIVSFLLPSNRESRFEDGVRLYWFQNSSELATEELLVEEVEADEKEEEEVEDARDLKEEEASLGLLRRAASWVKEGIEGRSRCLEVSEAVLSLPLSSNLLPPPPPSPRTSDTD